MSGVNTNAFLDLLTTNAETIQQNSESISALGNLSAANLGSSANAVQAAQNASAALNAFVTTASSLNERITTNANDISQNAAAIRENADNDNLHYLDAVKYFDQQIDNVNLNNDVKHNIDTLLKNIGIKNKTEVTRPYFKVDPSTNKIDQETVHQLPVGLAEFDKNNNLVYTHHENVERESLRLPFYFQSTLANYREFTKRNLWAEIGEFVNLDETNLTDVKSAFNKYVQEQSDIKKSLRFPLSSETWIDSISIRKTNSALGVNRDSSETYLSPEEIRANHTPDSFRKLFNEKEITEATFCNSRGFHYKDPKTLDDPYRYTFYVDYTDKNPVLLQNSEKMGWIHYFIASHIFNKTNVLTASSSDEIAVVGFSKQFSAFSNSDTQQEKWKIFSIDYLFENNKNILVVDARVDVSVLKATPIESFSLLTKASIAIPIEHILHELIDNSYLYSNLSDDDTFYKYMHRLFTSEEKYQKMKITTGQVKYIAQNARNGHLPDLQDDAVENPENNLMVWKPFVVDKITEYELTKEGFAFFVDQNNFNSMKVIADAINNPLYVNKTVKDIDNKTIIGGSEPDISLTKYNGTVGSPDYASVGSLNLTFREKAKRTLLFEDVDDFSDEIEGKVAIKEGSTNAVKEIIGYPVFQSTPQEKLNHFINNNDLNVVVTNVNGDKNDDVITYVEKNSDSMAKTLINQTVCNDYIRLAILVFSNKWSAKQALNENFFSNEYYATTQEIQEYVNLLEDDLKSSYKDYTAIVEEYEKAMLDEAKSLKSDFEKNQQGENAFLRLSRDNINDDYLLDKNLAVNFVSTMNYGLKNTDGTSSLSQERGLSTEHAKRVEPGLESVFFNFASGVNGKSVEQNKLDLYEAYELLGNHYAEKYQEIMTSACEEIALEILLVDACGNIQLSDTPKDKADKVLTWLDNNDVNTYNSIFEQFHGLLHKHLLRVLNLTEAPTPKSLEGYIYEDHTRVSAVTGINVIRSLTSTWIMKHVCGVTNCKVLPLIGNGALTTQLLYFLNTTKVNGVINTLQDASSKPIYAYQGMDSYNIPEYFLVSPIYLFNQRLGVGSIVDTWGSNLSMMWAYWANLYLDPDTPAIADDTIPYDPELYMKMTSIFVVDWSLRELEPSAYGLYTTNHLLEKIELLYRLKPIITSAEVYEAYERYFENNDLNDLLTQLLNDDFDVETYPELKDLTGLKDPQGLQQANQIILTFFEESSELHRMISNYINNYGSIKGLFATLYIIDINWIAAVRLKLDEYKNDTRILSIVPIVVERILNGDQQLIDILRISKAIIDVAPSCTTKEIYYNNRAFNNNIPLKDKGEFMISGENDINSFFDNMLLNKHVKE